MRITLLICLNRCGTARIIHGTDQKRRRLQVIQPSIRQLARQFTRQLFRRPVLPLVRRPARRSVRELIRRLIQQS
jgi:hypothetical protein